jgi:hypothetical protein
MPTPAKDLIFIQAGLDELEDYLLSDVLFWPLAGSAGLQRLTPGGLLLGMARLQVGCKSPPQSNQLDDLLNRLDIIHGKRRAAWEQKSRQEAHARLNLWKDYLGEYRQSPESQAGSYPRQVQWRVLVQLLRRDSALLPEDDESLAELDKMVKSSWLPGVFIWEPDLETVFPEPEYWFLYGTLKS